MNRSKFHTFGLLGSSVGLVSVFHMTTCTPLSKTQLTNTDPPEAKTKTKTSTNYKARDIPDKSQHWQQSSSPPPLDSTITKQKSAIDKKREIIDQSSPPWPQTSSPYPLSVKTNWSRPLHPRLHFWLVESCISFFKLLYCKFAMVQILGLFWLSAMIPKWVKTQVLLKWSSN